MSSSINDLKQKIRNLKEKKQRIQQSIRHIWDDIGGLQSDTKEQHRLFPTQEDFREAIQVREHHVERLEFTLLQIEETIRELEERIEMGKEDKKGAGFSRERETNNGNLRLIGGNVVSDDEMSVDSQGSEESEESNPDEYPFQYNDVLDVLETLDDLQDDDERRERWDEMGVDAMMTDSNTHLAQEPHLILAPDQEFWVTEVQQLYQFWRNHLFPPQPPQPPAVPHVEGGMRENLTPFIFKKFDFNNITSLPALNQAISLADNLQNKWITFKNECEDNIKNNIEKKKNVKERAKANLQIERYQKFLDDLREMAVVNFYPK